MSEMHLRATCTRPSGSACVMTRNQNHGCSCLWVPPTLPHVWRICNAAQARPQASGSGLHAEIQTQEHSMKYNKTTASHQIQHNSICNMQPHHSNCVSLAHAVTFLTSDVLRSRIFYASLDEGPKSNAALWHTRHDGMSARKCSECEE